MEINVFTIISFVLCVVYQAALLDYATLILKDGSRNRVFHILLGLLNATLLFLTNIPFWFLYLTLMPAYLIEFRLLSKAPLRQLFCGASIFVAHISCFHLLIISVYVYGTGIAPQDVLTSMAARQQIMIALFIILLLALIAASRILPIRDMRRVTSTRIYSEMLGAVSFSFTIYFSIAIYIYFNYKEFPYNMQLSVLIVVTMLTILYYIFMFIINFINLHEFKRYADKLGDTYSKMQTQKQQLATKIERDELTGLFNRNFIQGLLKEYFEAGKNDFGILFLDVNRLKYVNDNFGHDKGDRLLKCVANALKKSLRDEDASARIGGDEFLVVLSNLDNGDTISNITDRINEIVFVYDEIEDFPVSVSIGGIFIDNDMLKKGLDEVLALVDVEMRKNKERFYVQKGRYEK